MLQARRQPLTIVASLMRSISFDNVRRVEVSNRGRRVSIYDMEFDDNMTEGSGVNA